MLVEGKKKDNIYVESLPHHLQNKFFLSLKRARTGAAICREE
jgi:hypothetical protein